MEPLCVTVWTFVCHFSVLLGTSAGVSPSAVASFNDTRCASGGVCSTDPLFFTCGLKEVAVLRVLLPTGYKEVISLADTTDQVALPAGFMAVSLSISILDTSRRNIFVKISIANASLLDGGEIVCDDTTGNNVTAGCPLLNGKWLSTAVLCGITGVGVFIIIAGGGTCLLLIFLFKKKTKTKVDEQKMNFLRHSVTTNHLFKKKTKTKVDEQKMNFLSPSPGPASPVIKETPADRSSDVEPTHKDPITTMDTSHHSDPPKQVVIDSTYSTIADLHTTYPESGTPCPSQPYLDGPVTEEISIPASDADPYYQDPNTITHTPHPTTGVIYTNPEKKKKLDIYANSIMDTTLSQESSSIEPPK